MKKKRSLDAIWGFIVGDALGVPYEFSKGNSITKLKMVGHGTHNQPAGTWSDDTSFLLATLDSKSNIESIFEKYLQVLDGKYSINGDLFDIGAGTRQFLRSGCVPSNYIRKETQSKGNGSLMRVLPFALKKESYLNWISGRITHDNWESRGTCEQLYNLYKELLEKGEANVNDYLNEHFNLKKLSKDGFVIDSLLISTYIGLTCQSFDEAMIRCINLGGDTDTHCAIVGSIVGIRFGTPKKWINKVLGKELIEPILERSEWLK